MRVGLIQDTVRKAAADAATTDKDKPPMNRTPTLVVCKYSTCVLVLKYLVEKDASEVDRLEAMRASHKDKCIAGMLRDLEFNEETPSG
jgi:hypothetical protein